jgi:hypothetical protein
VIIQVHANYAASSMQELQAPAANVMKTHQTPMAQSVSSARIQVSTWTKPTTNVKAAATAFQTVSNVMAKLPPAIVVIQDISSILIQLIELPLTN